MIEEQFVSFDTARMLKEAGFHIPCIKVYNKHSKNLDAWSYPVDSNQHTRYYSAPTQALAARWLREVHRIVVDVAYIPPHVGRDVWQDFVGGMDDMVWPGDYEPSDRKYETYEEALEAGISFAFKKLNFK